MLIFQERLKRLRLNNNLLQETLAEELKMTRRNYIYLESSGKTPTIPTLIKIADYFGVSLDYLVGRTDNPDINR